MKFRQRWTGGVFLLAAAASIVGLARHIGFIGSFAGYRPLMIIWTVAFGFSVIQWLLSLADMPWRISRADYMALRPLTVVVNVPVYNEEPATLDRCLYSLARQTRPPDRVEIVDDGSDVDYTQLREHWHGWHGATEFRWIRRNVNMGKKHVQAVTFAGRADIFVTVDSDTALERRAIAEGIKPFRNPKVMSVAGIELAFNSTVNWLTRTVSARSLYFQIVACGAQSVLGDVLVNRGAYALYRSTLVKEFIPAYLNETFLGRPVSLGDDAALTLFAQVRGRAVQQPTAFALTMYPEKLSHHFRQWIRWMRGSTIRNCWRIRYLPVWSYGWWFTIIGLYTFVTSTLGAVLILVTLPQSSRLAVAALVAMIAWSYLTVLRVLCVRRSDESAWFRFITMLSFPAAMLWATFVLRPLRYYGIATCMKQSWTTRTEGVEVEMAALEAAV